ERDADANLSRSLRYGIGDDAVDAERRESERDAAEEREERHLEAALAYRRAQHLLERARISQRLVLVHRQHLGADERDRRGRIARGAHDEAVVLPGPDLERQDHLRLGILVERLRADVADDADDAGPL